MILAGGDALAQRLLNEESTWAWLLGRTIRTASCGLNSWQFNRRGLGSGDSVQGTLVI